MKHKDAISQSSKGGRKRGKQERREGRQRREEKGKQWIKTNVKRRIPPYRLFNNYKLNDILSRGSVIDE